MVVERSMRPIVDFTEKPGCASSKLDHVVNNRVREAGALFGIAMWTNANGIQTMGTGYYHMKSITESAYEGSG